MRLNLDCLFLRTAKGVAREGAWGHDVVYIFNCYREKNDSMIQSSVIP